MNKILLLLAMYLVCGYCNAQGFIDHVVQRGETLEFLATKFGVSKQDIRDQNEDFDLDILYVGLPLQIPIPEIGDSPEEIERLIASRSLTNNILNEANLLYNNGSYRKAAKLYTAAIKDNASSDVYYLRGRCYLYQGKYKSAIKDLEMANAGSDLSYSLKTSCESLLAEAHDKRDAQLEAREEIWGSIFAVAAVTAATVATASAADNNSYSRTKSSTSLSSQGYNLPPELQPEIAARNAVAQIKVEEENFKANYRATFKRNWGREPSDTEVMEAYTNYLKAKNDAYAATNSTTSSSTTSSTSTSGSSTNTSTRNSNTTTSKDCPSLKVNNGKWYCINTGKCGMCGGDGLMDGSFGQGANSLKCTLCGGTGKCKYCSH